MNYFFIFIFFSHLALASEYQDHGFHSIDDKTIPTNPPYAPLPSLQKKDPQSIEIKTHKEHTAVPIPPKHSSSSGIGQFKLALLERKVAQLESALAVTQSILTATQQELDKQIAISSQLFELQKLQGDKLQTFAHYLIGKKGSDDLEISPLTPKRSLSAPSSPKRLVSTSS